MQHAGYAHLIKQDSISAIAPAISVEVRSVTRKETIGHTKHGTRRRIATWSCHFLSDRPRIEDGHTCRLEISNIASDYRHTMNKSCSGNERITFSALVWNVQFGAA